MERLSKISVGVFALCMGLMVGCDSGGGAGSASASAKSSSSSKTATSTKASTSSTSSAAGGTTSKPSASAVAADTGSAKAEGGDKKEVDITELAKEDASGDKGVLNVDLSKATDDAPALGGTGDAPEAKDGKLEWLPTPVGLEIPNPGWKKSEKADVGILASPDDKGGVVFAQFGSPEEGLKKVDTLSADLGLKNLKWSKPTEVTVGPDKLPGYVGAAKGEDEKNKPVKVFDALVKSGGAQNLLALGGADEGADDAWKMALDIIDHIRKKK